MIIKAQKPKLDGVELEDVIDLSINIGNSASPSTVSITFVGEGAEHTSKTLTSKSLLEVGGLQFYGDKYSVSSSNGDGGLTSTLEMIDQSFDILDRFYIDLNISNHGRTGSATSGDYIFVGSEYYSFTQRTYFWSQAKMSWEVDNNRPVRNSTLPSAEYKSIFDSSREVYRSYQRALRNIEAFQGRTSESVSSVCTDQEVEPSDSLLLPGGEFSGGAQDILNFSSMTNPYTTKGEVFYRGSDIPRNPFGLNALFNATGPLRSVISSIAGQVGKSWYWDCTKDYSDGGGILVSPDASDATPYEPRGHSYTKGVTRANSFSEGLIYKRYIEGEEAAEKTANEWVHSESGVNGCIFEDVIDEYVLSVPDQGNGNKALLLLELGEELYKALWIAIEGGGSQDKFTELEKKVINARAFAGNEQLADLLGGDFQSQNRDGEDDDNGTDGEHTLKSFAESDWTEHLEGIAKYLPFISIWRACGPSGDAWFGSSANLTDAETKSSKFPYRGTSVFIDPTLREVTTYQFSRHGINRRILRKEFFPVTNEVVGDTNMCLIKGSASVFNTDDEVKKTTHGQIFSIVGNDSACSEDDVLDKSLRDFVSYNHVIVADNSTWSYEFPPCVMETLKKWSDGAIIQMQDSLGPMELGKDVTEFNSFTDSTLTAVKTLPAGFKTWESILPDYKNLITSDKVTVRQHFKQGSEGFVDDGLYSESLSRRICSSGRGKSNWAIQSIETGAEINTSTMDEVSAFGGAQCVDETPFISYIIHGEWEAVDNIGDLDSISVSYGSSGISTSYSRSFRKSISPSALIFSGLRRDGVSTATNISGQLNNLSTKFKNTAFMRQPPRSAFASQKPHKIKGKRD